MEDLSFTTFIKLGLLPTTQGRIGQIQRMLSSERGYDFYKQMKFAAKEVALGKISPASIIDKLKLIPRASERDHNVLMAENFLDWWAGQTGAVAIPDRPAGTYRTTTMQFGIKMRPELAFDKDGVRHVVYLWATKTPKISNQAAGSGLFLLQKQLKKGKFADAKFSILNLRNKKLLSDDLITNQSSAIALAEISQLNEIWKNII